MVYIRKAALEFILYASRNYHPKEFMGLLRGNDDLVTEVLVIPGTVSGSGFAHISTLNIPIDNTIIGSVHSHPATTNKPSNQDRITFPKSGNTHIISKYPYKDIQDLRCYDRNAKEKQLRIDNKK